jgi:transposase
VTEKDHPVQEVAARLGVSSHSVYKWMKAVGPEKNEQHSDRLLDAEKEIPKLRAEPRRVREERNIPKKITFSAPVRPPLTMRATKSGFLPRSKSRHVGTSDNPRAVHNAGDKARDNSTI